MHGLIRRCTSSHSPPRGHRSGGQNDGLSLDGWRLRQCYGCIGSAAMHQPFCGGLPAHRNHISILYIYILLYIIIMAHPVQVDTAEAAKIVAWRTTAGDGGGESASAARASAGQLPGLPPSAAVLRLHSHPLPVRPRTRELTDAQPMGASARVNRQNAAVLCLHSHSLPARTPLDEQDLGASYHPHFKQSWVFSCSSPLTSIRVAMIGECSMPVRCLNEAAWLASFS